MNKQLQNLLNNANTLLNSNRQQEAMIIYKRICEIDKRNTNAWTVYGALAGNLGMLDDAIQAFKTACKYTNTFGKQHEYLIQALEKQNKYHEAIDVLLKLIKAKDAPHDVSLRIGILYGKCNDFENAVKWINKHIKKNGADSHINHCLASAYESLYMYNKAALHYQAAIKQSSQDHILLNNYAALLQKTGNILTAIEYHKLSISINSQYSLSHYNLGNCYLSLGDEENALECFNKAVDLNNDYIEAIIGQGKCYYIKSKYRTALKYYDKVLNIDSNSHDALTSKAQVLISMGDFESAHELLAKAVTIEPDNIATKCSVVRLYEKRGQFEQAENILRPLIQSFPHDINVVISYSILCEKFHDCDKALELIKLASNDSRTPPIDRPFLHYRAGAINDRLNSYDEAFKHYKLANELQSYAYDKSYFINKYNNIESIFSSENMRTLPRSDITSESPIFIVGMPRSGTTLVEQIIASHPEVYGAGELQFIDYISSTLFGDLTTGNKNIRGIRNIDTHSLTNLGEQYLENIMNKVKDEIYFTDKMPHNFESIGLISILFPRARIIHCTRNPIDNCLSIYFNSLNSRHPYSNQLNDLADYYIDYYLQLMTHWESVNTIPIHHVSYEDLVNNQEKNTRVLLEFCSLDWDDRCMDFHKSNRDVATISYDQVREPLYNKSISRWKNYEKHITPLLERLHEYVQ